MRILIQTLGSAGDTHPFIGIGAALKARGHEVAVVANEVFKDAVEKAGLECIVVGTVEQFRAAIENPDLWHPIKGLRLVMQEAVLPGMEPTIDALCSRLNDETILVHSTLGLAARIVRELHDVPLVTVHLAPSSIRSNHRVPRFAGLWCPNWAPGWQKRFIWWFGDRLVDPMIRPRLDPIRKAYGLPPVSRIFHQWCHSPDRIVGLFPDWFGPPQPDWPAHTFTTGFSLFDESSQRPPDEELHAWLDGGEPPVVFTFGSAQITGHRFFGESVDAARRLGRRALLVTQSRESVPRDLPESIRHVEYAPFSRILPRAAALVSHAGIGTCGQGLAVGLPHLAVPKAFDQFDNASRLVDLGAGAALPSRRYNGRRAAAALEELLAADTSRGRELAARVLDSDPITETCERIEQVR